MSAQADRAVLTEVARWQSGAGSPADVTRVALRWAWGDEAYARVLMERGCYQWRSNQVSRLPEEVPA